MATTTYEEERKRPDLMPRQTYAPPTNTATQQAQVDSEAFYNTIMQRYAEVADPRRQAEEDARIQRGRQFWTGANLFANVIANAINANGTANNAPAMTWNNEMEKNMYATWRDADRQLRADRQDAQRRYDAMGLQQQQMRLEAAKAQDAAAQKAYDINFQNANADIADQNKLAQADYEYGRKKADEEAARQQAKQDKIDFYDYQRRHPMPSRSGGSRGGGRGSSSNGDISVSVGSVDIPAKDKKEAERIRKNVADKIVDKLNKDIEERNKSKKVTEEKEKPISKPKSDKEAQEILYQYGGLYDDDADFRDGINSTYGIEDIYAEEAVPEFEQFGGHSVRPDESSLPEPRRYAGTTPNQTPRAYRGNPVTWNSAPAIRGDASSRYFKDSAGNLFSSDRWGDVYVYEPKGNGEGTWELFGKRGDINAEQVKKQGTDINNLDEINRIADEKNRNYSTGGKGNAGKVKFNFG